MTESTDSFKSDYEYLLNEWKSMANGATFAKDCVAGLTVALVALPLNLAFALASGVSPAAGIVSGIISGIVCGLFGGQRFAISGPSAALAVVLIEIAQNYGLGAVELVCLFAGVLQLLAGRFRLGRLISFIPMPVVVGFSNSIGLLLIINSIGLFLGSHGKSLSSAAHISPTAFFEPELMSDVVRLTHFQHFNLQSVLVGAVTLGSILFLPQLSKRLPIDALAIVFGTVLAFALHLDVPVVGGITSGSFLPMFAIPQFPLLTYAQLFPTAITVFVLASIESTMCANIADGMTGSTKHHSNQELIGQGLANLCVPFFGGIPVSGSVLRTAINIRAGARTRLASIIRSVILFLVVLVFSQVLLNIPLAAFGGFLIAKGLKLIEWDATREIWRGSRTEGYVVVAIMAIAILVDVTAGVFAGLLFASVLFIRQMSDVHLVAQSESNQDMALDLPLCKFARSYIADGPLFLGAAEKFVENIMRVEHIKVVILHLRAARFMDMTGIETLLSIKSQLQRQAGRLVLAELPEQPMQLLERTNAIDKIGRDNLFTSYRSAVLDVNNALLQGACANCTAGAAPAGPKDCRLRNALLDESSPVSRMLEKFRGLPPRPKDGGMEWLFSVDTYEDIPTLLRDTPIETLLKGQNLGIIDDRPDHTPELVIGMCIDYRKSLTIPRDWAFTIRREGANMDGSEFAIALGASKGIKHMALIAHNHCAMSNTKEHREKFVSVLAEKYQWDTEKATLFFDDHCRSHDIGNEVDFVLREARRLSDLFPGLMVVPVLFRVEDDKLYLIYDWLIENAPGDPIMKKLALSNTGNFKEIAARLEATLRQQSLAPAPAPAPAPGPTPTLASDAPPVESAAPTPAPAASSTEPAAPAQAPHASASESVTPAADAPSPDSESGGAGSVQSGKDVTE